MRKIARIVSIVMWVFLCEALALTYYVNHHMPRGAYYPTGEIVCMNDGRGPCGEAHEEDLSNLDIPEWAKLWRENWGLVVVGLFLAGVYFSGKAGGRENWEEPDPYDSP